MNTRSTSVILISLLAVSFQLAAETDCSTNPGAAVPDGTAAGTATFTVGTDTITVTLSNPLADPKSAGQLLSGLQFTLSTAQSSGTLNFNSAQVRRVKGDKTFADLGPSGTGWELDSNVGGGLLLCVLCTDLGALGPKRLIIGEPAPTGTYSSANSSIAGNRPHNPFDSGTATFVISVPGVTADTTVTSATFFYGTANGASGIPGVGVGVPGRCSAGGGVEPQ